MTLPAPLDDTATPDCACEFAPDPDDPTDGWHFLRRCSFCSATWYSLHCPHDLRQRPCPHCRSIPSPVT